MSNYTLLPNKKCHQIIIASYLCLFESHLELNNITEIRERSLQGIFIKSLFEMQRKLKWQIARAKVMSSVCSPLETLQLSFMTFSTEFFSCPWYVVMQCYIECQCESEPTWKLYIPHSPKMHMNATSLNTYINSYGYNSWQASTAILTVEKWLCC